MKYLVLISRLLIGSYLIITGLVNANDVIGYSYKLEGIFTSLDLNFWVSTSVLQAGILSFVSMLLGGMLLLGEKVRMTLFLVTLFVIINLISALFLSYHIEGNLWNNGIFQFFLLQLCLFLLVKRAQIKPLFSPIKKKVILTTFILGAAVIPFYSYSFLPIVDFGNYPVGEDIQVVTDEDNRTFNCFEMDGRNATKKVLEYDGHQFLVVIQDIKSCHSNAFQKFNLLAGEAEKQGIPFLGVASNNPSEIEDFRHEVQAAYPFLQVDQQVLRSMIRSNPGLILLDGSTIVAKWHFNSVPSYVDVASEYKLTKGGPSLIQ
jgi:hypothetical protein